MRIRMRALFSGLRRVNVAELIKENSIWVVLVVLALVFSALVPAFRTQGNLISMLRSISVLGILTIGLAVILIGGGFDLSIASLKSLGGITFGALLISRAQPWGVAALGAIAITTALGFVNGILVTKVKLNAFLATFAVGIAGLGLAQLVGSAGMGFFSGTDVPGFAFLGMGHLGPIPMQVVIFLVVVISIWYLITKCSFGRAIYASGSNESAARMSGINVDGVRIKSYMLSGFFCGLGGLIIAAQLGTVSVAGSQVAGFDVITLDTLAAVFIGGVSVLGGVGRISSVICAVIIIGVLTNGLSMLGIDSMQVMLIKGVIIIISVMMDVYVRKGVRIQLRKHTS
ncbi:ABC transporter permease [Chloroflexota bacterium]